MVGRLLLGHLGLLVGGYWREGRLAVHVAMSVASEQVLAEYLLEYVISARLDVYARAIVPATTSSAVSLQLLKEETTVASRAAATATAAHVRC